MSEMTLAKAKKLFEALCQPHDERKRSGEHAWRECRTCLARQELEYDSTVPLIRAWLMEIARLDSALADRDATIARLRAELRDELDRAEWRREDRRDRIERLLSAVDWAGDLTDWCDGTWVMRPDWRMVILNALLPAPPAAKDADRG